MFNSLLQVCMLLTTTQQQDSQTIASTMQLDQLFMDNKLNIHLIIYYINLQLLFSQSSFNMLMRMNKLVTYTQFKRLAIKIINYNNILLTNKTNHLILNNKLIHVLISHKQLYHIHFQQSYAMSVNRYKFTKHL